MTAPLGINQPAEIRSFFAVSAHPLRQCEKCGLGRYVTFLSFSGPLSEPPRLTWPDSEILPDALVGVSLNALLPAQRSTYKVVRAVSEVECIGFFDCLNAYDNAFVSGG